MKITSYEPALDTYVTTAHVNHEAKTVRPAHGYFYPHPHGKRNKKIAERWGYKWIQS